MALKITPKSLGRMRDAIEAIQIPGGYSLADVEASYRAAGHSHRRFRWDALRAARRDYWALYEGEKLGNDHIDSALRSILGSDYPSITH